MGLEHRDGSAYRRAADYVAAALIFLQDNVLLREPLRAEHIRPRLLGPTGDHARASPWSMRHSTHSSASGRPTCCW
ncbi:hypothetical protein ACOKM5_43325 [Streptomyces sp. BH097]|uniref:hypothetical protein n=1 Tax=unclassified Streptomyces TaxID=2593676 RepID=UPI003BB744B0